MTVLGHLVLAHGTVSAVLDQDKVNEFEDVGVVDLVVDGEEEAMRMPCWGVRVVIAGEFGG